MQVFTNLGNYPIAGCFVRAEEVTINDEPVTVDDYGGFRNYGHRYRTKPNFFIRSGSLALSQME